MPQVAPTPDTPSAVASGTALSAELLQSMADDGLSRQVIADLIGCSKRTVNYWLRQYGISTTGRSPNHEIFGTRGDKPPKLVPSAAALRAASVFNLGRGATAQGDDATNAKPDHSSNCDRASNHNH